MAWPEWSSSDGRIRLINADCLEVLPTLSGVDAVVTDPPYGIGDGEMTMGRGSRNDTGAHRRLKWDSLPATSQQISAILSMKRPSIIWGGNYFDLPPATRWLIWDKRDPHSDFASAELAWTNIGGVVKSFYMSRKANSLLGGHHPTQKPVDLIQWCFGFLPDCELILDPFAGSCTTAIACIRSHRSCICIEREPSYYEAGIQRVQDEYARTALFNDQDLEATA